MKIIERPRNLSEWVLFSYEGDIEKFGSMITHGSVDTQYVKKLHKRKGLILAFIKKKRGKSTGIVEFDMT